MVRLVTVLLLLLWMMAGAVHAQNVVTDVQTPVALQGTLQILVQDSGPTPSVRYFLKTGTSRVELHFAGTPPTKMLSGANVRINGQAQGGDVMLASAASMSLVTTDIGPAPLTLSSPNTFGNQSTIVLLVNFQDDTTQPLDPVVAHDVVFNQTDAFLRENSQNQTFIADSANNVLGWYTLPMSKSSCNVNQIGDLADQAAAADVDVTQYRHVVYAFSESACDFTAAAYLGGNRIFSNGPLQMQVIAHGMGNNLGLMRSSALNCSPAIVGNNCPVIDNGDLFDTMGATTGSHFNAFQKERLGYLNFGTSLPITVVTTTGTYDILPYETTTPGSRALKILKDTDVNGVKTYYYIEYRQPIGFDAALQTAYPFSVTGVLFHIGIDTGSHSSFLLDMHPFTPAFDDAALQVGETFIDPVSGIHISLTSADSSAAHVKVTYPGDVCITGAPAVAITPLRQSAPAGTTVAFLGTITNTSNAKCDPETFTISNLVPPGWTGSLDVTSLNLAPGGSGSTHLLATSPAVAVGGDYKLYIQAQSTTTNAQNVAQGTYAIPTSFALTASPLAATVVQGGTTSTVITSIIAQGFSSAVNLSFTGLPTGVTATLTPNSFPAPGSGTSTLAFTVGANVVPGSYPILVTGVGGTVTQQTLFTLNVNLSGDFSLAAAPGLVSASQGTPTTSTITSTITGTFNSAVALSVSGLPTGVTAAFTPASLVAPGSGSSTLTLSTAQTAAVGSYTLTVTGVGNAITHTTTVTLVITPFVAPNPATPIPQSGWSLKFVDSQETDCSFHAASFAFDGKPDTFWQTLNCIGTAALPHEMQINLGATYPIAGFRYLPRQDGQSLGKIATYEFYVSADGVNWGSPVATGTLITDPADKTEKQVLFNALFNGRYVRLRALSEVSGGKVTSMAELNVLTSSTPPPPPPSGDFSLSASPNSVSVVQGNTGTSTITSTISGVFSSPVALSVTGLPANVTAAFSPTSIPTGAGTSTLTFTVAGNAAVGTYPLTVTGVGNAITHTTSVSLVVTLSNQPPPTQATVIPQTGFKLKFVDSAESTCGLFVGAFAFDGKPGTIWQTQNCLGAPPPPHEIQIDLGDTYPVAGFRYLPRQDGQSTGKIKSYEFYVSTDGITWGTPVVTGNLITDPADIAEKQVLFTAIKTGRYVRLRALTEVNGGMVTSVAELNVLQSTAPPPPPGDFSLSAAPSSVSVAQGGHTPTTITSTLTGSFSSAVALSVSGLPSGVTAAFSPATINAPGSGTSTLTFTATATATVGPATITVTGTGGGFAHTTTVTLTVTTIIPPPPNGDFSLAASPSTVSVAQGATAPSTITSTISGTFNSAISLAVTGLPTGVTAVLSPNSINAPGSGTSTLTFTASGTATLGPATLTVTGIGGGFIHTTTIALTVTPPPPPPSSLTPIPQTGWKLKFVDSQETTCGLFMGQFAFDGKSTTIWQTQSCLGTTPGPHEIQIDLGATYTTAGFRYLPRQDGQTIGKIAQYEFYVSTDGITWGSPVVTGTLITDPADKTEHQVVFNSPVSGRYVRLRAMTEVNGGKVTSVAELNVLQ